jgi:hypothetical protein
VNIQPVPLAVNGPLTFVCCKCGQKVSQDRTTAYADLDGAPWKAYYCPPCALPHRNLGGKS